MALYGKSKLANTPWHISYKKRMNMTQCNGSDHCKFYSETEKQWKNYLEEMKTEEVDEPSASSVPFILRQNLSFLRFFLA